MSRTDEDRSKRLGFDADGHYAAPSTAGFVLLLVFIPVSYLQFAERFDWAASIRLEFVLGLVLSILSVFAIKSRAGEFHWTSTGVWGVLMVLVLLMMSILSIDVALSWKIFVDRAFKFALLGLFIAAFVSSPMRLKLLVLAFLLACAKMGQEGMLGTLDGSMIWENQGTPRLHGSTPNYAHPNSFSGMAIGVLPFIAFIYPRVSWKWKVMLVILLVLMLNIILRTGSRTGYVAFAIFLLWLINYAPHKFRSYLGVATFLLICLPLVPADYIERAETIFEPVEAGENVSAGLRKETLIDAWQIFLQHPFGVGVGAFPKIRIEQFGRYQDTHNLALELLTNIGVQGAFVFAGFVLSALFALRRIHQTAELSVLRLSEAARPTNVPDASPVADLDSHISDLRWITAMCSATIGFIIVRLALGLFGHDLYERYWWFAGGLTVALACIFQQADRKTVQILLDCERSPQSHPMG